MQLTLSSSLDMLFLLWLEVVDEELPLLLFSVVLLVKRFPLVWLLMPFLSRLPSVDKTTSCLTWEDRLPFFFLIFILMAGSPGNAGAMDPLLPWLDWTTADVTDVLEDTLPWFLEDIEGGRGRVFFLLMSLWFEVSDGIDERKTSSTDVNI
jgi:hypothetical protein